VQALGKTLGNSCGTGEIRPSVDKAKVDDAGFMRGLKSPPPSVSSFPMACEVMLLLQAGQFCVQ